MQISFKWLGELVDFKYTPSELDHILTMLGIEVEGITDNSAKYARFYTAKVLKKEKHPDADKLSVCTVKCGDNIYSVVCGAPNVADGQSVVLGINGAVVPDGGFTIENRTIRGVKSEGMICSRKELGLDGDHSGIWVLPEDSADGIRFAEYLKIDDAILEISVTPNRADCLSHLGLAREISARCGSPVRKPEFALRESETDIKTIASVIIEDTENCPRYTARVVREVKSLESPQWLKDKIVAAGFRPLNLPADVTNFVMIECGQPMHAFDLDTLKDSKIIVKTANNGDKFTTLDGKERELDSQMLMICDSEKYIGIGGVMGGANTEITSDTKNILLESAYFRPQSVRRTAKKLGLMSESSYRFERGTDIDNVTWALDRAAYLISELGGGEVLKGRLDEYPIKKEFPKITVRFENANRMIGAQIAPDDIVKMLESISFRVVSKDDYSMTVIPPSFRVDQELEIDVIEEIVRLYNYDNLEPDYTSSIDFSGSGLHSSLSVPALRQVIREYFVNRGFREILTQNMLDPKSSALFTDNPVYIANPLGEELSIMRPSMIPSVLMTIERNIRFGNPSLQLFEIGKAFSISPGSDSFIEGYREEEYLTVAICGSQFPMQWDIPEKASDYYSIRGVYEDFTNFLKAGFLQLKPSNSKHPVFSKNTMSIEYDGTNLGYFGEISREALKKFEIEIPVFMMEISLEKFYGIRIPQPKYKQVSSFPGSTRDLAFLLDTAIPSSDVKDMIARNGGNYLKDVQVFDVYAGKNIPQGRKSIAYKLFYSSEEKTLTDTEIEESVGRVVKAVEAGFKAEIRKF